MERVKGIEPSSQAWEARILPLNHTRLSCAPARQARRILRCDKDCGFAFTKPLGSWQQFNRRSGCDAEVIDGVAQLVFNPKLPLR
jgi:hypothetical protein